MRRKIAQFLPFFVFGIGISLSTAFAEEDPVSGGWPQWRGPANNGVANGNPPTEWAEDENVKWKVEIPGSGASTPIVVGDKIFLLTAIGTGQRTENAGGAESGEESDRSQREGERADRPSREGRQGGRRGGGGFGRRRPPPDEIQQFAVVCLDRKTGKPLWQKVSTEELPHEGHHESHGYASASPLSDGEHLYAYFGSRGLHCFDLEGNLKWKKDFGDMRTSNNFGEGTSPAIHGDTLVVKWDHEDDSFIAALDKKTGDERWRKERDEGTSWSTPYIVDIDGKAQIVASATNKVIAYDLETGDIVWETEGLTSNVISTPVSGGGLIYVMSGHRGSALQAIELGRSGKLTEGNGIAWTHDEGTPYVPSPILYDGRLYFFQSNSEILSCLDAKTGKPHYSRERIEVLRGSGRTAVYASPVAANGHIYLLGQNGTCVVIKSSDKLEIVASNKLDENFDASPAIVGNEILLRGHNHLYCIGEG